MFMEDLMEDLVEDLVVVTIREIIKEGK